MCSFSYFFFFYFQFHVAHNNKSVGTMFFFSFQFISFSVLHQAKSIVNYVYTRESIILNHLDSSKIARLLPITFYWFVSNEYGYFHSLRFHAMIIIMAIDSYWYIGILIFSFSFFAGIFSIFFFLSETKAYLTFHRQNIFRHTQSTTKWNEIELSISLAYLFQKKCSEKKNKNNDSIIRGEKKNINNTHKTFYCWYCDTPLVINKEQITLDYTITAMISNTIAFIRNRYTTCVYIQQKNAYNIQIILLFQTKFLLWFFYSNQSVVAARFLFLHIFRFIFHVHRIQRKRNMQAQLSFYSLKSSLTLRAVCDQQ